MAFSELYYLKERVGHGSFGEVFKATSKMTGDIFAVKVMSISNSEDRLNSSHEAAIWRRLDHENIVRFKQILKTPQNYYIVVEFVNGGNLFDRIITMSSYTEHDACVYMHQLLNALDYLSKKRIVHRDIKPDNLLLMEVGNKQCLKLTDFGLSIRLPRGTSEICCKPSGAPLYTPPEVIYEESISFGVDHWACGVILYIMLSGYPPFWNEKTEKLLHSIAKNEVTFPSPFWDNVSEDGKDFIHKLLTKDKRKRMSCLVALSHPWICRESMAPRIHRHTTLEKLRVFNARRKLRGVIFTIQAMTRATRLISRLASMEEKRFKGCEIVAKGSGLYSSQRLSECNEVIMVEE